MPQGWAILPFAIFLGLGLAVLTGLAMANRARIRAVLRPSRGRVIGALILGFLTPFAVYDWLPWIVGGASLILVIAALTEGQVGIVLRMALIWFLASAFWYPASCLIVSGTGNRRLRVALFALLVWAAYAAVLLAAGTRHFML